MIILVLFVGTNLLLPSMESVAPQTVPFKIPENLEEGQRLGIICAVAKGTLPISFQWRKDNVLVVPGGNVKIFHYEDYQETLQISKINQEHVGNYTCSVKNAFGSDQMSTQVILKFKPHWVDETVPGVLETTTGGTALVDCRTIGYPAPTLRITKG